MHGLGADPDHEVLSLGNAALGWVHYRSPSTQERRKSPEDLFLLTLIDVIGGRDYHPSTTRHRRYSVSVLHSSRQVGRYLSTTHTFPKGPMVSWNKHNWEFGCWQWIPSPKDPSKGSEDGIHMCDIKHET